MCPPAIAHLHPFHMMDFVKAFIPVVPYIQRSGAIGVVSARKIFHAIALALFFPGIAIRHGFMAIAFAVRA